MKSSVGMRRVGDSDGRERVVCGAAAGQEAGAPCGALLYGEEVVSWFLAVSRSGITPGGSRV